MPNAATPTIHWINTDKQNYPQSSPFDEFWVPHGKAFFTPNSPGERGDPTYRDRFKSVRAGDLMAAYEDDVGIKGLGRVIRPFDPSDCLPVKGMDEVMTWKMDVEWDPAVTVPTKALSAVYTHGFRGTIKPLPMKYLNPLMDAWRDADKAASMYVVYSQEDHHSDGAAIADSDLPDVLKNRPSRHWARINHHIFVKNVLALEPICRVTGTEARSMLRASHLVPWRNCKGAQHLDGANGLMLAPHVDHLFERYYITFEDTGELLVSAYLNAAMLHAWNIAKPVIIKTFNNDQRGYLAEHRRFYRLYESERSKRHLAKCDLAEYGSTTVTIGSQI